MNFDREIYKTIFNTSLYKRNLMKVTLYCTTKDEDTRYFRANQIIQHALLLQDGTFKVHLGEYQDPKVTEDGDLFGHADYYIHNHIDIERLLQRDAK